jgi:hypothetical protein
MLELEPCAVALAGDAHLDLGRGGPVGVGLPGEDDAVRRLPGEDGAPFAFLAVVPDLVNAAADQALEDGGARLVVTHRVRR